MPNTINSAELFYHPTNYLKSLQAAQQEIINSQSLFPKGDVYINKSRNKPSYYIREKPTDTCGTYLKKSQVKLISQLLQKKYNEKVLKYLTKEINQLNSLLNLHSLTTDALISIYEKFPEESQKLINPIMISDQKYIQEFNSLSYCQKEIVGDVAVFETDNGELVRSKSELTIANFLKKYNIPYKYEMPLTLYNKHQIYPDFTVLDVKNRKLVYWEHRGMMDDRLYARDAVIRFREMQKSGIILGKNLIITEETSVAPLGTPEIVDTIKNYFL